VARMVGTRKHVRKASLEHDADPIPAHACVVQIVVRTLEIELEAEALAVERDRCVERSQGIELLTSPHGFD